MPSSQHMRLFSRWLEHAPDYVSFGLVILCGFLLAHLTWLLFPAEPRPALTESTAPASSLPASPTQSLGDKIAGYHLFGNYQPDAGKPVATNIQPTQLALKLQGIYAPSHQKGYAVIEENGQQSIYAIGENIGNSNAQLEQILADHVLLRRNGLLEKLDLPKPERSGGGDAPPGGFMDSNSGGEADYIASTDASPPDSMPPPDMINPDSAGAVPPPLAMETQENPLVPPEGNNLNEFRQSVLNNNARLLEVASPQPYERDGKFLGFQLNPGSNVALFNQLGLQAGDIVTSINGTTLDSPAIAMKLLQDASTSPQVTLNITRNGQAISLPINFQQ